MGRPARDLSGQRFGRLLVIRRVETRGIRWLCMCDCGQWTVVHATNLTTTRRPIRSCGCSAHPQKHGMAGSRLFQVWASMHARCNSPSYHARRHYGGRGIRVCDSWQEFDAFAFWAKANGYRDDLTLDRIDNDGHYTPSNCRFITIAEQQRNRSCHRLITHDGETLPLFAWARRAGLSNQALHNRLSRGWPIARALTTPVGGNP